MKSPTPGPWTVGRYGMCSFEILASGTPVAICHPADNDEDAAECDARLIAAAPELLAFARAVVRDIGRGALLLGLPDHACSLCVPNGEIVVAGFRCGVHGLKDAIAKAEGWS